MAKSKTSHIEGLFLVIERENARGLKHWGDDLERRKMPAVIQIGEPMIEKHSFMIGDLSDKGFEIGGACHGHPFWNQSYQHQYEEISRIKHKLQSLINKPMRVFNSKFFAYDETTLRVADKLDIEYIMSRGTFGAKAVVSKPEEYHTKIISVSNVPWKEMGTGSLCDESLWCRGATPEGLREVFFNLEEDRIVLVAQPHLSGVKLHWWNVYQNFLNANWVLWETLDEFAAHPIALPNAQIPVNMEVEYITPQPKIPLEQELEYPFEDS